MPRRRLPSFLVPLIVWLSLPPAWAWVCHHERRIRRWGRPLREGEIRDAQAAGVRDPRAIRVLIAAPVPTPGSALLRRLARFARFPLDPPFGMALGHGIYLDERVARHRAILVHECVHVAQYERLGGRFAFLRRYLDECLRESYWTSAMEVEASRVSEAVCADRVG